MALSDDDVIQENTGSTTGTTSLVVSLPSGTTAGNTLIVAINANTTISALPAGFENDNATGPSGIALYRKSDIAASETSWTFTLASALDSVWWVVEMSNIDADPFEVQATVQDTSMLTGATLSTGTTAYNFGLSVVVFAFHGVLNVGAAVTQSYASHTNGFVETAEINSGTGASHAHLSVSRKYHDGSTAQFETTATLTHNSGGSLLGSRARVVVYREKGSPIAAPLLWLTGFEFGTHAGMASLGPDGAGANSLLGINSSMVPVGTWGTHYLVQAGSARNGGYGLRVATSAATCNVTMRSLSNRSAAFGFNVRVVSGSGVVNVATIETQGTDLNLVYDTSTTQFGLVWGAGTVSYESGTTALNTWRWVDIRVKAYATTHHADWTIETDTDVYTAQTSPADLTGQPAAELLTRFIAGGLASQTVTMDFDDVVVSNYYAAHPLGPHVVRRLTPETTGATVSGTAGNFNQFTANGTLAAFASTNGALLDEVPPTVSASSDGVVQVTAAASDYMNFPMTTYTLAADEVIAAVRMLAALWGGTGSATGTLGVRGWDGTTETTLLTTSPIYDADSLTTASSTYPMWGAAMWSTGPGWTQVELDGAAVRVGFSTDATPDMGVSALYLEVATRDTFPSVVAHRLTSDEDPEAVAAKVTERLHPYSSGVRTYTVSNDDATRTAEFRFYETGGAEHADSPVVVAPTDPPVDVVVGADAFGEIESTTFGWQ